MATGKVVTNVQSKMVSSGSVSFTLEPYYSYLIFAVSGSSSYQGLWVAVGFESGSQVMTIQSGANISVSASGLVVTFTQGTRNTRYTVVKLAHFSS